MSAIALFTVLVALLAIVGMASERIAGHRVALAGFAVLLVAGALSPEQALGVIGASGIVTVVCMFLLAAALEYSGVIDHTVRRLMRLAGTRPRMAWVWLFALVLLGSAVIPNTPVVVLAAPAAMLLAQRTRTAPGQVLIPVAFLASLGGSLTLIGSSVNVVAGTLSADHGGAGFDFFTLTPIALPVAIIGMLYLILVAPRLLPRQPVAATATYDPDRLYLMEESVGHDSALLGRPLAETLLQRAGIDLVEVYPAKANDVDASPGAPKLAGYVPQPGDRLLLRAPAAAIGAAEPPAPGVDLAQQKTTIEVWIPPASRLRGLRVDALRLERIHGIDLLGVAPLSGGVRELGAHRLVAGDRLLLYGPREELERFVGPDSAFGPVQLRRAGQSPERARIALALLAAFILCAATGWLALEVAALATALALVALGAGPGRSSLSPVLMRTIGLILGVLGIGAALEATGASAAMATPFIEMASRLGPWGLLIAVYLCATVLSELVTNNASVVLVLPIAAGLATSLGLDPTPFAIAVLMGASASFATPIGYQTNTWVYQLGGYRFLDFARVGLPLKLVCGSVTLVAIGMRYPLA